MRRCARRGVASILGTVVFVLVFMIALGSLAYAAGLQAQAAQAEGEAQSVAALRGAEAVTFVQSQAGVEASDGGAGSVAVNHVVLRFPNGTVYALAASAEIPAGGSVPVAPLVPSEVCTPGTATCSSKYESIVSGAAPGASVGVVTGLGNVFWYFPAPGGGGWAHLAFTGSGTWAVPQGVTAAYVVCIGGGGGGGGSGGAQDAAGGKAASSGGGGGGAGSLAQGFVDLAGVTSVPIQVGAGGAGGGAGTTMSDGGTGGNGSPSSFGSFVACSGGQGGGGGGSAYNAASSAYCELDGPSGGAGDGVPGGSDAATPSGGAADALQETTYGGGGGGGGSFYYQAGRGSPSSALDSGSTFVGLPGSSAYCSFGGGGGSASPFGDGGTGGAGATACGPGTPGGTAGGPGAGGGGGGGAYSPATSCGAGGAPGGAGGPGEVAVYYYPG